MSQIESEINQQSSETKAKEYDYGFSNNRIETLNASSIVNSVFLFLSRDWSEEERKRLLLNEQECRLFDLAITPMVYRVAVRLGLAVAEAFSVVVITGLLLPRLFVILSHKHEKKAKEVDKVGA
ncbi:hypothetical protein B9Q01_10415 [Candidatus Marsarchaeota G1 archaeon OSP_D]|jgi:hypothetical protein|uniref:Uncharacterized protein n=1 Tax=Candidatus Marsarchaeota G1 archaeon OSP_D TaxID=1978155 RepID=A0A2R6A5Y7_9ARCH|nr:MAG: hypothetical protein B9Q01_10415 [Candidatus Marsarchaeota G1 archaeon OSP_D]